MAQVLVSQGVNQHTPAASTRPSSPSATPRPGSPSGFSKEPKEWHERPELLPNDMFISSRDDLSLEHVNNFLTYFLRTAPTATSPKTTAPKKPPSPLFKRKARSYSKVLDLPQHVPGEAARATK